MCFHITQNRQVLCVAVVPSAVRSKLQQGGGEERSNVKGMHGMSDQGPFDISGVINTARANKQGICFLSHVIKADFCKQWESLWVFPMSSSRWRHTHKTGFRAPDLYTTSWAVTSSAAGTAIKKLRKQKSRFKNKIMENKVRQIFVWLQQMTRRRRWHQTILTNKPIQW